MQLYERDIAGDIRRFIDTDDIIVVHGARQVGKTSLLFLMQRQLEDQGKPTLYLDLEDLRLLELINSGVDPLLQYLRERGKLGRGKLYLFIDEIQYLEDPSRFLKLVRDHHAAAIKLFVSGSSSFGIRSKFKDSLVGRTVNFELFPLNFREFLAFKGSPLSLEALPASPIHTEELKQYYREYVLYGGYPRIVLEDDVERKEIYLQQIIDTYIRKDIRDLANIRDVLKFNRLLEALASQCGRLLNVSELANSANLSRPTVDEYLFLMENTYVLELLRPFSTNLRSELFKTPKVYFYDTGIAQLLALKTLVGAIQGNMFETSVFAELAKNRKTGELFYWRTQDKKEIDFVVRRRGKLYPIEIKTAAHRLKRTPLRYFTQRYETAGATCVVLEKGEKPAEQVRFAYPWELYEMFSGRRASKSTSTSMG